MADRSGGVGVSGAILQDYVATSRDAGAGAPWLGALRQAGLDRFQAAGFPSTRDEDWRFLNLAPITGTSFRVADTDAAGVTRAALAPFLYPIPGVITLVFVNGRFAPALSDRHALPRGITLQPLAAALAAEGELVRRHLGQYATPVQSGFTALNTAFVADGLFLRVSRDTVLDAPVHAVFVTHSGADGVATHPRNLILVERGARAGGHRELRQPGPVRLPHQRGHRGVGGGWRLHSYLDRSSKIFYENVQQDGLPFTFTDAYGKLSFNGANGSKFNLFGFNFSDGVKYRQVSDLNWNNWGAGTNLFWYLPVRRY